MKSYKKIFVYMTDREKKEKILSLCGELNLGLDEISYAQINTPLVELVGLPFTTCRSCWFSVECRRMK